MPAAQADTPRKQARRSRRPPRKSESATSSQVPSSQDADLSTDTGVETQSGQPTRILRRGEPDTPLNTTSAAQAQNSFPHTPPRPKSMYAGPADKQQTGNGSAPESSQNSKRKTLRTQGRKQSAQASPMPAMNTIPISTPRRDSAAPRRDSVTPNRATETPSKAYAGPTFHASPAASSLPMPKFYSKSVPNVNKNKSLSTMMEQEAPESSSGSERSPVTETFQPYFKPKSREDSPLDIFFRADREAKSRTGSAPNIPCGRSNHANAPASPFSIHPPILDHTRSSSVGGMFALEMDGTAPEHSSGSTSGKIPMSLNKDVSASITSPGMSEAEREENRKAQTIALKRLLHSPRPQISQNNSAGQRPPSSKLRKELSMPTSPEQIDTPELPATPTPSRVHNSIPLASNHRKQPNGHVTSYPPFPPNGSPFTHDTTKSIEDDLRRILKMDVLGSDSATVLRS